MSRRSKKSDVMEYPIHCLKCKKVTQTVEGKSEQTASGRYRVHGGCAECGGRKSKFVNQQTGEGLLGKLLGAPGGKLPILGDIPLIGNLLF